MLLSHFSCVRLCATPQTAAHQASPPWDSPGKNTGVGCHFLLQCMKVKSESEVTQSCPTLCNPMDWSPSASSIHGIFQARVLEWGSITFSNTALIYSFPKLNQSLIPCPVLTVVLDPHKGFSEADIVIWYSCFFNTFPQFVLIYTKASM